MNRESLLKKIKSFPVSPGVYIFKDRRGAILYVGKATSLKDRAGSYFSGKNNQSRPIEVKIGEVEDIEIKKTDTVLEAYLLEQNLIKNLQPKYNAMGKDDKSFCYVAVTKDEFPRFVIARRTELENAGVQFIESGFDKTDHYKKIYGPYTSKKNIEIALKILRKIFPYHSKPQKTEKGCLDSQIGLCPGPYNGEISREDYRKNIRGIRMIFEGKKVNLIRKMKMEMEDYSKAQEFEKAADTRNKIFLLQHIQDIALIRDREEYSCNYSDQKTFRIEGYDISNISGRYSVGSMVVFDNSKGEFSSNKNEYRKFKIKTVEGANDVGAMEEVLIRRFKNNWKKPNLILLDGGAGHLNMARRIMRNFHLDIPILAVAKGPERKKLDLRPFGSVPELDLKLIEQIRDEAHRFAIAYHKKLRSRSVLA